LFPIRPLPRLLVTFVALAGLHDRLGIPPAILRQRSALVINFLEPALLAAAHVPLLLARVDYLALGSLASGSLFLGPCFFSCCCHCREPQSSCRSERDYRH